MFAYQKETGFNSRLVRLVVMMVEGVHNGSRFQFQIGAIGSILCIYFIIYFFMFQFQIGAIGRLARLLLAPQLTKFQFQIGAIGRRIENYNQTSLPEFQFQIGAIGSVRAVLTAFCELVSIPDWCDW